VVGGDLGAPRVEGVAERTDLLDVVLAAARDGIVEQRGGHHRVVGEIDVPN
jgi:hypothetical protein